MLSRTRHSARLLHQLGFWLAALALLGQTMLPVVHAGAGQGGTDAVLISPALHGEPCLAGDADANPDSGLPVPARHPLTGCECLTCKLLQAGVLPALIASEAPATEGHPVAAPPSDPPSPTPGVTLPPSRAPPAG